jgi:NAD(P)-dependent dehydrogenase (short-subunit alcohol dehydrogenase family)
MLTVGPCAAQAKSRNGQLSGRNSRVENALHGYCGGSLHPANAVSPGAIRTELGGGLNDEFEAMLAAQTALGRVGEPEDVARVIAMLLSEDSAWINAQTLEVAGGYNI